MKVEVEKGEPKSIYPYIGVTKTDRIVLFTAKGTGIQINHTFGDFGANHGDWRESDFAPFTGTVTLSND